MSIEQKYDKLQNIMSEYADFVYASAQGVLSFVDITDKKIVDFGCGRGDWLKAAKDAGASEVLGLDTYALEHGTFDFPVRSVDLTKPLLLEKRYDIALCLEVGEHLDARSAGVLVESLVRSAPMIFFSAAVPGQGGIGHINEQPPAYWHELFSKHGYVCYDFRSELWNNSSIQPWYRMGALVYCAADVCNKRLERYYTPNPLHLVHPEIFEAYAPKGRDIILHYNKAKQHWYPEFIND